jgi:hypothetical protein
VLGAQREYLGFAVGLLLVCGLAWMPGWQGIDAIRVGGRPRLRRHQVEELTRRDLILASSLIVVGGLLYFGYVTRVGLGVLVDRDDYGRKYLLSEGLGVLAVGLILMMAGCLWAEVSPLSRARKAPFRLIALALAIWSVGFMSMRSNMMALLLGYLWIHCRRRGVMVGGIRLRFLLVIALGYVGMESFSVLRGSWSMGRGEAWELVRSNPEESLASIVGGSELAHPFLTTLEVMQSHMPGELAARSYRDALPALVPRALDPDRPETLSEGFVREHYAQYAELGGGTGFSLVAEAWLNLGSFWGPLAVGLLFGALLMLLEVAASANPEGILARLAPNAAFLAAVAHRAESASLLKHAVAIILPVLLCWLASDLVARTVGRGREQNLASSASR